VCVCGGGGGQRSGGLTDVSALPRAGAVMVN